jgi:Protein-kinase domain of FAM69
LFRFVIANVCLIIQVDFAEPLAGGGLWEHEEEVWSERLRSAVLILELLERLETTLPIPLRLCDVRLGHIGRSFDGAKATVLDGDSLVTQVVADALAGDGSPCKDHPDCHYLDCYSACEEGKCVPPSTNNNLQVKATVIATILNFILAIFYALNFYEVNNR